MAMPTGLTAQPAIRLPMARLSAAVLGVGLAVSVAAALIAGWFLRTPWTQAAYLATGSVLIGSIIGLGFLKMFPARPAFTWAVLIIGNSMIRIAVSLLVAAGLFFRFRPEIGPFWGAYLAASLAILAVEAITVRPALLRASGPESPRA